MIKTAFQRGCIFLSLSFAVQLQAQVAGKIILPAQLATAKNVFVANAGGPLNHLSEQAYASFYAALSASKKFHVTSGPVDAELAFEISVSSHLDGTVHGDSNNLDYVQLTIRDIKTQSLIWTITERLFGATLSETRSDFLQSTSAQLVADLDTLRSGNLVSSPPVTSASKTLGK